MKTNYRIPYGKSYRGFEIGGWHRKAWIGLIPRFLGIAALIWLMTYLSDFVVAMAPSMLMPQSDTAIGAVAEMYTAWWWAFFIGIIGLVLFMLTLHTAVCTGCVIAGYIYTRRKNG